MAGVARSTLCRPGRSETLAKAPQSVIDGLKAVYPEIAGLALAPDAAQHMQFIGSLQQAIQRYVAGQEQHKQQMMQQIAGMAARGQVGPQGPPGQPPGPQGPASAGPPAGGMQGPPPAQGAPGLALPNADEFRRMLATQGAQ